MKNCVTLLLLLIIGHIAIGQDTLSVIIRGAKEKGLLSGVSVRLKGTVRGTTSDSTGKVVFKNRLAGHQTFIFSHVGYKQKEVDIVFPVQPGSLMIVELEEDNNEEGEVVVAAVRSSRTIKNLPTRVETISGEELDEKGNMKPGDIRMMLNESTGIQTQQTSATSYNSSIRIQGLDGRYTQVLKDGFPLYAGFSGGLSIMQIPPLDLRQVEIIKGSSSTLYGGGAIAGLVNLVSKVPGDRRELNLMINGTSAKGLDINGFYAEKYNKIGVTLFASRNTNAAYDPAGIGLTAIPKFERYTVNPRLFLYFNGKTTADIGVSFITESRLGGDISYIEHNTPGYFENNHTNRLTTQAELRHFWTDHSAFSFKNSVSVFKRRIEIPGYFFDGTQTSSFSEATYSLKQTKTDWIAGFDVLTDQFREVKQQGVLPRDYDQNTMGGFIQNTWNTAKWLTIESGLRGDYVSQYGFNLLPRVAILFRINHKLTSRIGGGLGYKAPTVFTEDAEKIQFQNVLPIDARQAVTERSEGINFDVNYRTTLFGGVGFSVNNLLFHTRVGKPLVLMPVTNGDLQFVNANGHIDTKGMETNVKFIYKYFKLFIGYTYADVNQHYDGVKSWYPLNSKHRLNNVLVYEKEGSLKIGLEAYYFSPQKLTDGAIGKQYWICGVMGEKMFKRFSIFINFENIFDTRQTRFDTIYTGTISNPMFRDIYAPVDGFIVNGGIKLRL